MSEGIAAMIKSLEHLTSRDKRALAIFAGLALLCSFYFASGILVTYVSQPAEAMEVAKDGRGFTVRVLGVQTFALAEQLSAALRDQRHVPAVIEAAPASQGYLIKVGPLVKRSDAETLTADLHNSGYSIVRIVQNCGPGISDCGQSRQAGASSNSTTIPVSSPASDRGNE
ncbi:MAG: SPOR domain-containing protein [Blastocatellales bacterium]